jgi:hypothetical protein
MGTQNYMVFSFGQIFPQKFVLAAGLIGPDTLRIHHGDTEVTE